MEKKRILEIKRVFDLCAGREFLPVKYYWYHSGHRYARETAYRNNHQYFVDRRWLEVETV